MQGLVIRIIIDSDEILLFASEQGGWFKNDIVNESEIKHFEMTSTKRIWLLLCCERSTEIFEFERSIQPLDISIDELDKSKIEFDIVKLFFMYRIVDLISNVLWSMIVIPWKIKPNEGIIVIISLIKVMSL